MTPETTTPPNTKIMKPEFVPDKFWDSEKQEVRLEAMAKSYMELEKRFSGEGLDMADESTKSKILKLLGRPDTPDEYEIETAHGLFENDAELNQLFFEKGFTKEQVQIVYDAAAEKLVPLISEMAAEFEADREVERLIKEFGGDEQWQEISRQLLAFGQKNLPQDVLEGLASSYEGVMALYRMMAAQDPSMNEKANMTNGTMDEKALQSMMRDPKYWKEKDASTIAKVTQGFESIYGDK